MMAIINEANIRILALTSILLLLSACGTTSSSDKNKTPTISGAPTVSVEQNTAYNFTPNANDPEGDPLTFGITNLPAWANFNTQTGELSGTPTTVGDHLNIVISVSDGTNTASLPAFNIEVTSATPVNNPPTISGTPNLTIEQDSPYSFTPGANDPDGDLLTFSVTARPTWASFNTQTGELSGTPTAVGDHLNIVISVSDGTNTAFLPAFNIEVTAVPPTFLQINAGSDQTINVSDTLSLNATVTENGLPPISVMTYNWAQNSGPGIVAFDTPDSEDSTASISEAGSYTLELSASNGVDIVSDSLDVTVNILAAGSSGIASRPTNTTECIAPDTAPTASAIQLSDPFPNLPALASPLAMFMAPGDSSAWYVVLQAGRIVKFDNTPSVNTTTSFLDITSRVRSGGELGLLGMAFHPAFSTNGFVYASYTNDDSGLVSRISRFNMNGTGTALDPASEQIILTLPQPNTNHNGGQISFGTDGYLYIGFGDGGSGGDPSAYGQDTSTWLGAMLRIDVNSASPYSIPPGNPFAASTCDQSARTGQCPEIFAYGLRNPWRWSFDRNTGDLWAGDVGQGSYEEIDIITNGSNYGWNIMEGLHCYNAASCDQTGLTLPVTEYDHTQGFSVTGGYVYRGLNIPFLQGQYLYGDYGSGIIWGLEETGPGQYASTELLDTSLNIASFAEDNDGELYVINISNGSISKIIEDAGGLGGSTVPSLLSDWGCFQAGDTTSFSNNVIPYDINALLWSDQADKGRFMAIPDGTTIDVDTEGRLIFPEGSVIGKNFWLNGSIIETRLLLHHPQPDGWKGYSYEWNAGETDATLLTGAKNKDIGGQTWHYPSSAECDACHTTIAGITLGPEIGQLNREYTYPTPGTTANQLITLESISLLTSALTEQQKSTAFYAIDDTAYSAERRARSYLHSNCANCHQPGGPGGGNIDLRIATSLANTGICNEAPLSDTLGLINPVIISPGNPDASILVLRMENLGQYRMPPLGTNEVDTQAITVIREWITGLSGCT